ncbi:trihelix transcription factor ASR3 isoform X2 [Cornus florida]|uniref:trihelix transcription factor ASR3 isoform X2 n=1 Tax=Cornus florida TaxID=4283 RepID=UPI0028986F13|nr:trihelix transcription factor ASR3 isoform X2 [Cornus florida]
MANTYGPTKIKEEDIDQYEMELGDGPPSRVSGSRRTRSQVAPDWTVQESMILVNEISAVEGECLKTLSSFQKWSIIVENCNALDVARSLNQCRRKWDSLLSEYNGIKQWESESKPRSYWSLDGESRREFGLPENFDAEVFDLIDVYLKAQGDRCETDPDSDPEAKVDVMEVIAESGFKKQRRRSLHKRRSIDKRVKPQKHSTEEKLTLVQSSLNEKVKPPKRSVDEKIKLENSSVEEEEQMMAAKLLEDVELMNDILEGNLSEDTDFVLADLKNMETSQTDFTRCQGDRLIACLGNLSDTLDRLCDLVQECG